MTVCTLLSIFLFLFDEWLVLKLDVMNIVQYITLFLNQYPGISKLRLKHYVSVRSIHRQGLRELRKVLIGYYSTQGPLYTHAIALTFTSFPPWRMEVEGGALLFPWRMEVEGEGGCSPLCDRFHNHQLPRLPVWNGLLYYLRQGMMLVYAWCKLLIFFRFGNTAESGLT